MKKMVVMAPFREPERKLLEEAAEGYEIVFAPDTPEDRQPELLKDARICIGEPSWEALEGSSTLRLIQMTWAGADRYTAAGRPFPSQINLCTASGAFGPAMSHYALGAVLTLLHHFPDYQRQKQDKIWRKLPAEKSMIGSQMLIFGAGNIGSCTAALFRAAGAAKIIGVRRSAEVPETFDAVCTLADAQKWLPTSDIVIGCMPATKENYLYMNAERLASMKEGAVLVNMGRGNLIDDLALAENLKNGHLYAAALDVTYPEPLPADHPLWDCENAMITPHVAGPSFGNEQTERLIAEICCENICRFRKRDRLRNCIFRAEGEE